MAETKGEQVRRRIWLEFRFPLLVGLIWVVLRYLLPNITSIPFLTDFTVAFFLTSWFTGQYFRIVHQEDSRGSLKRIDDATTDLKETVSAALRHAQEHASRDPIQASVAVQLEALSTAVNTKVEEIRSANKALSATLPSF